MSSTERPVRGGVGLAVLSGLILALAYPWPDAGPVAFVALAPFLLSLRGASRAGALWRGYAAGLAFFVPLLYWIARVLRVHGDLPWAAGALAVALLAFYLSTYIALFAMLVAASWRRLGSPALAAAPVFWVAFELLRGRVLGGFPWGLLGYSQHRNLPLLQSAAVGGVYAVSFLVMAANAAVALALTRPATRATRGAAAALLGLTGLAFVLGAATMRAGGDGAGGEVIRVAAIQANVAQERKWSAGEGERVIADLTRLTREAAAGGARLVVWPESSSPYSFNRPVRDGPEGTGRVAIQPDPVYVATVTGLARDLDVAIIAGSVDYRVVDGRLRATNSAFAIAADGSIARPYDKIKLVPFGEYVPLGRLLFFVNRLVRGAIAEFEAGERFEPLPAPGGPAATFVCYEAVFPELVRRLARRSGLLVNVTNDAWFARTAAPEQHLAMAAVRAVENRRYLVRAANTGISAIVDPFGRVVARTRLDVSAVLTGTVRPRRDVTPYARGGDLFAYGCAILTLLHAVALRALFGRASG